MSDKDLENLVVPDSFFQDIHDQRKDYNSRLYDKIYHFKKAGYTIGLALELLEKEGFKQVSIIDIWDSVKIISNDQMNEALNKITKEAYRGQSISRLTGSSKKDNGDKKDG